MTTRNEAGVSWTQGFDEEGRLDTISDSTDPWTFTYDGDGNRVVQANPDGTTTLFLGGGSFEVHLSAGGQETLVRRYYSLGGQRVLLDGTDTYYLLTDHLGSVVAVADSDGDLVSEQRYLPYGEGRFTPGITETDFGFTGQRNLAAVGLMDYHARWYSQDTKTFFQPDTLVPNTFIPSSLNRYSYVQGNPIRNVDPTGHFLCSGLDCENLPDFYLWAPSTTSNLLPDGERAYTSLQIIAYSEDDWWDELDAQEAVGIYIFQEFETLQENAEWEAVTRKYHEFCSAGIWTSSCLNGFWGYAQAWLSMPTLIGRYKQEDLTEYRSGKVLRQAIQVMHPSADHLSWLEGEDLDRPGHWATLYNNTSPDTFDEAIKNMSRYSFSHREVRVPNSDDSALTIVLSWNQKVALCVKMSMGSTCSLARGMP